jgi:hypothetical protein
MAAAPVEIDDLGIQWLIDTVRCLAETDADNPFRRGLSCC